MRRSTANTLAGRLTCGGMAILLWIWVHPALAEAYKWTDGAGNVYYGQIPPPGTDAKRMVLPASPPPTGNMAPAEPEPKAADAPETESDDAAARRAAVYRKNCAAARGNLEIYTRHRRIMDKQGEVIVLSNDEREARIREAREMIERYCSE